MATVIYDVFAGEPGKDALWVQAVAGLENAQQRMRQPKNLASISCFVQQKTP